MRIEHATDYRVASYLARLLAKQSVIAQAVNTRRAIRVLHGSPG